MKIAIVRREPKVAFSMDVYADNLVLELKKIRPDWQIVEIAPQPWGNDLDNLWRSGNPFSKYYERFVNHPRAVSRLDADIFHIIDHTNGHIAYWLKKLGKPIIVTCHDLVQYVYPEILKNQARFPALSMAAWQHSVRGMRAAERIVAVSQNTAQDAARWLNIDPQKISIIPNGVESSFRLLSATTVADWKSQHTISDEEICLLNIGSNHQRKNILTVLKVVKELVARKTSVRLWRIGNDFTTEQKQFIENFNLAKNITLVKKTNQEDLIKFYNAADVLLAPSLYEGFGLTVLEAMACGTPVITSRVSSLPEVAGNAAILVDPLDTDKIVWAIGQIQQDSSCNSLISEGLSRAKLFTWAKTAEKVAQIYQTEAALKQSKLYSYTG